MYRVWYYLEGELELATCGVNAEYAWTILMAYYPDYRAWVEFVKRQEIPR